MHNAELSGNRRRCVQASVCTRRLAPARRQGGNPEGGGPASRMTCSRRQAGQVVRDNGQFRVPAALRREHYILS